MARRVRHLADLHASHGDGGNARVILGRAAPVRWSGRAQPRKQQVHDHHRPSRRPHARPAFFHHRPSMGAVPCADPAPPGRSSAGLSSAPRPGQGGVRQASGPAPAGRHLPAARRLPGLRDHAAVPAGRVDRRRSLRSPAPGRAEAGRSAAARSKARPGISSPTASRSPAAAGASPGAEALLPLRAIISNGDFAAYWRYHVRQEHTRLYPRPDQADYRLTA